MERYDIEDLLYLMARLRDPQHGCPWDIKQSYKSVVPSTLEEAYEVADTIEREDFDHLPEELGDLLFQVVFYSQLGSEDKRFDFHQLVHALVDKLIRRHPHVFTDGNLRGEKIQLDAKNIEFVGHNWEAIKQQERENKGLGAVMSDVPINLPSVTRAQKLQKRAATVNFDFLSVRNAMEKVHEELAEVEEAIADMESDGSEHKFVALGQELGDLLFSVINVARLGRYDAESLLRATNRKFERRFIIMETLLSKQSISLNEASLEKMNEAWLEAKTLQQA